MWDLSQHNIPDYNAVTGYTPGYGAWSRLSYTTTPDTIIVNRGVRASLFVEPMYEDTPFVHSLLSASQFVPIHGEGFDAHVLELSANAGVIGGKAPVFDRFYAGGLGSVRGFDVWGISPQFDGVPIGGYWMLTGTGGVHFPDHPRRRGGVLPRRAVRRLRRRGDDSGGARPHPHRLRRRPARRAAEGGAD